ncbi:hypothetical protein COV20_05135 [Candidatus Woesearchaeota archaeon CG10_big_fil_rev_8_21_14_0_10_45_16]|nr:MAG: hypothetical protein COV20_05135 [Candidatus Woesearchaeota archaeon CG10_big_fil_rev_8_21_14_0_10_45_16]
MKKKVQKIQKIQKKITNVRKQSIRRIKGAVNRCQCPNNRLFIIALLTFIAYLLLEVTIRIYNLYRLVPVVDVPSHLVGGAALGCGIFWIVSLNQVKQKGIFTFFLAIVGAFIWELFETLQELIFYNPPYLIDIFWWDGFWDVVVTILGAILAILTIKSNIRWIEKKHKP